jgi:hypothetical protein
LNNPDNLPTDDMDDLLDTLRSRHPALHNERTFGFVKKTLQAWTRPIGLFQERLGALDELRCEYHNIRDELKRIGVVLHLDQSEPAIDYSAFTGDLHRLAVAMYRLGANRTALDTMIGGLYQSVEQYSLSIKGATARSEKGAANATAVRNEFARLLTERAEAKELPVAAIARELVPRLEIAGTRLSESSVRRHLSDLVAEIHSLASETAVSRLNPPSRIAAILERRCGSPGFTENTVKMALDLRD